MNTLDCLAGARPEVRIMSAACVAAVAPILEGKRACFTVEALARALAVVALSCSAEGREAEMMREVASFLNNLSVVSGSSLPTGQVLQ